MATLKAHLKSAREAISSQDWQRAADSAQAALAIDDRCYNASVVISLDPVHVGLLYHQ